MQLNDKRISHQSKCFAVVLSSVFFPLSILVGCQEATSDQKVAIPATPINLDSINNPQVVRPQADGTLLLRAEVARAIGPNIKYMPKLKVFGYFSSSDSVEWDVNVAEKGKYDVLLEWAISDEEAGKPFIFKTVDQKVAGTVPSTGSFYTHKLQKVGQVTLDPGVQKMIFKAGSKFDSGELIDLRGIWLEPSK